MLCQEIGHKRVRLLGFGKVGIIPEGVRKGLKDDQLRVDQTFQSLRSASSGSTSRLVMARHLARRAIARGAKTPQRGNVVAVRVTTRLNVHTNKSARPQLISEQPERFKTLERRP